MNTIPGCRWSHKQNGWTLPLGWAGCLALRSTFRDSLEIGDDLAKWASDEVANRINPSMHLRTALDAEGSPALYGYQRAGVAFLATAKRALCADEMGTGKTRQALMALQLLYMQGTNPFPTLIVAPNSTKISWRREAETVWPGLEVQVIKGSAAQRRKQLETPAHIYVMNWESVRGHSRLAPYGSVSLARCVECGGEDPRVTIQRCEVHQRELNQLKFNSVICDEAHRMKDPKAKQTRALWAATGDADIRIALTGTPIASTPDDLWTILHWISPEEWPARSRFIERMLEVSYNAFGAPTVIGVKPHMQEEFFAALDPRMRRMPKSVVLKHLPPMLYERRDVEMTPKQKKAYHQMLDQMVAELDDENIVVTTSPLVRVTRLLQFASSYATLEREWNERREEWEDHVILAEPSCKIDAFMNDLEDFGDDQIVVFAVSKQLINLLSKKLEKKGIAHGLITGDQNTDERQAYMDEFQAGKIKYMLCTVAAGGTGITLTKARVAVFLQRSWSMIDNIQAEARVHRIGSEQHDSVVIVDYVTAGTLEETVIGAVEQKSNRLEEILRDRALLKKVLEGEDE
jgi:SNF2 family DNA or RNA helicase